MIATEETGRSQITVGVGAFVKHVPIADTLLIVGVDGGFEQTLISVCGLVFVLLLPLIR